MEPVKLTPPRFEDSRELLIAGVNATYTFDTRVNIPIQWQHFAPRIATIPGKVGDASYGVAWNYQPGKGFDYLSGVEVTSTDNLPEDFTHVRLAPHRYAVFEHQEHVSSIVKTMEAIWMQWLPASGYKAVGSPSFERYTEAFNPQTGMGGMEIWIPIEV